MTIRRKMLRRIGAVVALVMVLIACGNDDGDGVNGDDAPSAPIDNGTDTDGSDGAAPATGDPFVIAFTGPLSGPVGEFIEPAHDGLADYFDILNARGGVNGRPIEFRSNDIETDVDRAVTAFREYTSDPDVLAVTGLGISLQMGPVLPQLAEQEIAGISITSSTASELPYSEWYFSWGDDLAGSGQAGLQYILDEAPEARIGYLAYDTPVMHAQRDAVLEGIEESDATLVGWHMPPAAATDVSTELRDLVDSGAEYIFFGGATGGIFTSAMSTAQVIGFDGTIVVAAAGGDNVDFEVAGSDSYEFVATRYFRSPLEDHPGVQEMVDESGTNAQRFYYTSGWTLGQYIEQALLECGDDCDRASFRDALEAADLTNRDGLAGGPYGFDSECHQGHRFLMFYRWNPETEEPDYEDSRSYWTDESHPCFVAD